MEHRLDQHLRLGTIFVENGQYIGKAADGTEVFLGTVGDEASLEGYLSAYPQPSDW